MSSTDLVSKLGLLTNRMTANHLPIFISAEDIFSNRFKQNQNYFSVSKNVIILQSLS